MVGEAVSEEPESEITVGERLSYSMTTAADKKKNEGKH